MFRPQYSFKTLSAAEQLLSGKSFEHLLQVICRQTNFSMQPHKYCHFTANMHGNVSWIVPAPSHDYGQL